MYKLVCKVRAPFNGNHRNLYIFFFLSDMPDQAHMLLLPQKDRLILAFVMPE